MNTEVSPKSNAGRELLMGVTGLLLLAGLVMAQSAEPKTASAGPLKFEAASIKAVAEGAVIQCGDLPCQNLPRLLSTPKDFAQ